MKELEKLKTIRLNVMTLDLKCLTEIMSLRELSLRRMSGGDYNDLANLTKLQSLSLQEAEIDSLKFINKLKNLKELEINGVSVNNLDFLHHLSKLKEFTMRYSVKDETALACISNMKNLQVFQCPVADMCVYQTCPKLNSIGIDASRVMNLSALNGNETIHDVMFCSSKTEKQFKQLLEKTEACLKLTSYGYVGELDAE